MLKIYCEAWGLNINVRKTKVMIFSKGKIRKMLKFSFNEETVDFVGDYKYLGVKCNYNYKFKKAQQLQFSLANRAMFSLLRKCNVIVTSLFYSFFFFLFFMCHFTSICFILV